MNKIYLVECSSGQYEDNREWIDSVWDDNLKANQRKAEIDLYYKTIGELENPIGHEDYNIMSEEEYELYEKWLQNKSDSYEYNNTNILEYELNTIK
jgi:hypothetical protein